MAAGTTADPDQAQIELLGQTVLRPYLLGQVSWADIASMVGDSALGAARGLAVCRKAAPKNIGFAGSSKTLGSARRFVSFLTVRWLGRYSRCSLTVELDLVPISHGARTEVCAPAFPMDGGVLSPRSRGVLAASAHRGLGSDCSPGHGLRRQQYRLSLRYRLARCGDESTALVPGHVPPGAKV